MLTSSGATSEGPGGTWYRSSVGGVGMRALAPSATMAPVPSGASEVAIACLWAPESASLRRGGAQAAAPREKRTVQACSGEERRGLGGSGLESPKLRTRDKPGKTNEHLQCYCSSRMMRSY